MLGLPGRGKKIKPQDNKNEGRQDYEIGQSNLPRNEDEGFLILGTGEAGEEWGVNRIS